MPTPMVPGFELEGLVGRGAHGEVWSARRRADGRPVALKLLRAGVEEEARLRFRREARVAAGIESAHVCRALEARTEGEGPLYIAYERLEGETLEDALDREGSLTLDEVTSIADGLLDALGAAHARGVVHRDVKPANVFLDRSGKALLIDFGVATAPGDDAEDVLSTTESATLGTLAYMAPEQVMTAATADPRADLYGLGAVLFRALSGRPPFAAMTPAAMIALKLEREVPGLGEVTGVAWPRAVEAFLRSLLAREPARRFATAAEARRALGELRARVQRAVGGG